MDKILVLYRKNGNSLVEVVLKASSLKENLKTKKVINKQE